MNLMPVKSDALEIIRLEKTLARDSTNSSLLDTIANTYQRMGNGPAPRKYEKLAHKR